MSEEEQEVIEKLKDNYILTTSEQNKLANLIDRLQKENEELKELNNAGIEKIRKLEKENYEYFKENEELKGRNKDLTTAIEEWVNGERINTLFCVSKDKIKDKIKELEKQCETELLTTWLEAKIEVLKELLEE